MIGLSRLKTFFVVAFIFVVNSSISQADGNGGNIQPKAEIENSDESFASSIWGAYLFSLLGIAAFAIIVGFILNFLTSSPRKRPSSLVNKNHRFQRQQQQPDPPQQQQSNLLNQETSLTSSQQQQQQQPITPPSQQVYTSQNVTELTKSSYQTTYKQHPYEYPPYSPSANEIQINRFSRPSAPLQPSSEVEQNRASPPVIGFMVPSSPPSLSKEKPTRQDSYATTSSSPSQEDSYIPKRAVLRTKTPYKIVEEKAKLDEEQYKEGEYETDTSLRSPNDGTYNYNNFSYQNNAFSGYPESNQSMYLKGHINNDGLIDSRFVRVLPRYPPVPPPKPSSPVPPSAGFHI